MSVSLNPHSKMEKTLVLLKPEVLQRRLTGQIISRYEQKGLYIHKMTIIKPTKELMEQHYIEHKGKEFFDPLTQRMCSGRVVAMVIAGEGAIGVVRKLNDATVPSDAELGSMRGDYGAYRRKNIVHGSDSVEAAEREIKLWFGEKNDGGWDFDCV